MTKIIRDRNIYVANEQLKTADELGRKYLAPINRDWIPMLSDYFSYSANNIINISEFDPRDYFQLGDRIHIRQGGSDKYFYVHEVSATQLKIAGGSSYTYTNSAIDIFESSRIGAPSGMGSQLAYTINSGTASTGTVTVSNWSAYFTMMGDRVSIWGSGDIAFSSTAATFVKLPLPFDLFPTVKTNVDWGGVNLPVGSGVSTQNLRTSVSSSDLNDMQINNEFLVAYNTTSTLNFQIKLNFVHS